MITCTCGKELEFDIAVACDCGAIHITDEYNPPTNKEEEEVDIKDSYSYSLTSRATAKLKEYKNDPLPTEIGTRAYIYYRNGWDCGPSYDGFGLRGRNEMNRSRCYKEINHPKTPGREDVWGKVLEVLGNLV